MWTLILIIIMAGHSNFSEIKTIQNFDTKQVCETAGNQWYNDITTKLKPLEEHRLGMRFVYTCVKIK